MIFFKDRRDAGRQLGRLLEKYKNDNIVVYGLPRGGVVVAEEIVNHLQAPLDLIFAHKIGHPYQPEYAIGAISEKGHIVGISQELEGIGEKWLEDEKERQLREIKRKRSLYLKGRKEIPVKGKVAIIVDDGIATGRTMQAGILELRDRNPKMIVMAVPVSPRDTFDKLASLTDDAIGIEVPDNPDFLGAVGAYYRIFEQVEDEEVIAILDRHNEAKK
jgi:putative phosphoribosyl transferase